MVGGRGAGEVLFRKQIICKQDQSINHTGNVQTIYSRNNHRESESKTVLMKYITFKDI